MLKGKLTQVAEWDNRWAKITNGQLETIAREIDLVAKGKKRIRSYLQNRSILEKEFGEIRNLNVIELGSGLGRDTLFFCLSGARATLVDESEIALEKATQLYSFFGIVPTCIKADVVNLSEHEALFRKFDVAFSGGLVEHFVGQSRKKVIKLHLDLVIPGGLIMIGVPNRLSPLYSLPHFFARLSGRTRIGELPFSSRELRHQAKIMGARETKVFGQNLIYGINEWLLRPLGYPVDRFGIPDVQVPVLDSILGFSLLLVAKR